MGFITNYRRDAKQVRKETKDVMEIGLDSLVKVDGTAESRQRLADTMKYLLNNNVDLETTNCKLEYESGKFVGVIMGGAAAFGGMIVGQLILKLIKK